MGEHVDNFELEGFTVPDNWVTENALKMANHFGPNKGIITKGKKFTWERFCEKSQKWLLKELSILFPMPKELQFQKDQWVRFVKGYENNEGHRLDGKTGYIVGCVNHPSVDKFDYLKSKGELLYGVCIQCKKCKKGELPDCKKCRKITSCSEKSLELHIFD